MIKNSPTLAKMASYAVPSQYRPRSLSTPAPFEPQERRLSSVGSPATARAYLSPMNIQPPMVPANTPIMSAARVGQISGSQSQREQQLARMAGRVLLRHWAIVLSMCDDTPSALQQVHSRPGTILNMPAPSQLAPGSWQWQVVWELRARVLGQLWPWTFQSLLLGSGDYAYESESDHEDDRKIRRGRKPGSGASRRTSRESNGSPCQGPLYGIEGANAVSAACPIKPLNPSSGRAHILDRLDTTAEYFIRELRWHGLEQQWLEDLELRRGSGNWEDDIFEEDLDVENQVPVDMMLPSGFSKRVYVVDTAAGGHNWSRRPSIDLGNITRRQSIDPGTKPRRPSGLVDPKTERSPYGSNEPIIGSRSRRSSRLLPGLPLGSPKLKWDSSGPTEKELHKDIGCENAWTV